MSKIYPETENEMIRICVGFFKENILFEARRQSNGRWIIEIGESPEN